MKSYSQFVAESNEVSTTLVEEVYQGLLEDGYTEEEIGAAYHFYEHLVEEGVLTENPLAGLARLGGRVLPGVGAGLYGADAVNRFRKGDWGGGLLQGAGAAMSLMPGVGGLASLAPAAINMATDAMGLTGDKSKGQKNYKPPAGSTPPAAAKPTTTQPAAPAKPKNTTVLALKGGVQGKLDKATGKFTPGDFTDAERQRYTAAGGKIPGATSKGSATTPSKAGTSAASAASSAAAPTSQATAGKMTQGRPDAKIDTASVAAAMKKANSPAVLNKPAPAGSALAKQQAMNKPNALGNTQAQLNKLRADAKSATMAKSQLKKPMAGVGPRGM
mgnify:CR=1 FL=1|tara:strand:+ start:228 stop:1217 length:990 start_codon:yes stop_codon:yes gene_type:complete